MLIIPPSAHEIDTVNTVVQKCMYISRTGNETETPNVVLVVIFRLGIHSFGIYKIGERDRGTYNSTFPVQCSDGSFDTIIHTMPGGVVCILLIDTSYLLRFLQSFSKVILLLREVLGPSIKLIQIRVKNG